MHRSSSTSRVSEEFLINLSPARKGSPMVKASDIDKIPTYNQNHDLTKKDKSSPGGGREETVVHIIPIVLILCAILLWVFSHPVVNIENKGNLIVQVEGVHNHGQDNQTHMPSTTKLKDLNQVEQTKGKIEALPVHKSVMNI